MRHHLGIEARTVYSMHIKKWLPEEMDCTIVIRVFEAKIPENEIKIVDMLELIEQGSWEANKPLSGKRNGLLKGRKS